MAANELSVHDFVNLTVREFVNMIKELNEHEADLKIKLAKAGVSEQAIESEERTAG